MNIISVNIKYLYTSFVKLDPLNYKNNFIRAIAFYIVITCYLNFWSGRRDSNPRLQPWQGCALPLSYARLVLRLRAFLNTAMVILCGSPLFHH